jgi:gamma-glutamyltranspeptidase/glutathione hydrolase
MSTFDWALPYPSQRIPILAANVVATSQPLAAQAGLQMLHAGGNAVDAALAAAIALTVVEPTSNGIGSDAFAIIWADGKLHGLNASGRSPAAMTHDRFAGLSSMPRLGWDAVTVPGAVSAWMQLHERFGTLPFDALFAPAIEYAERGFLVSPQTAEAWARSVQTFSDFEHWMHTFAPEGRAPRPGELFSAPDHARTLRMIASSNGAEFYRGELAAAIAAASREAGGVLNEDDLANHQADWVTPIAMEYHGYHLHEIPPNGQGLAALLALGILRHTDCSTMPVDSAASVHVQMEAMKLGFADAHRFVADEAHVDVPVSALLDDAYLAQRAAMIDPQRAQDFQHGQPHPGGTVYLAAADASGMMVSFIQSNYMGFGSGIVVPGTGIALQNRGANFSLTPGHPNVVGPSKRPYHTIIPGFVTRDGQPVMAFGVMGGFMQPQGHVQMLVRLADYHQNPQAALDAPRWRVESGLKVNLEPGFDASVYQSLRDMGHDLAIAPMRTVEHGGGQAVYRLGNGYFAASDQRRDGQAVGF